MDRENWEYPHLSTRPWSTETLNYCEQPSSPHKSWNSVVLLCMVLSEPPILISLWRGESCRGSENHFLIISRDKQDSTGVIESVGYCWTSVLLDFSIVGFQYHCHWTRVVHSGIIVGFESIRELRCFHCCVCINVMNLAFSTLTPHFLIQSYK